ncbi:MAG: alpha-amylase/4-alpha-glucanotransferase domain-containing protein, partial [Planctomycetota bacterium]
GEGLSTERADLDFDGNDEIWVRSGAFSALLAPARGGTLVDWTTFDPPHNWAAGLARRPEAYHGEVGEGHEAARGGIATIHDSESRRSGRTPYDAGMRALFVDRFPGPRASLDSFQAGDLDDRGDFAGAAYAFETRSDGASLSREGTVAGARTRVEKVYRFAPEGSVEVRWRVEGTEAFATEATFFPAFLALGGGGMRAEGREVPWQEARDLGTIARLEFVEGAVGARLVLEFGPAARVWTFPVQTLSRSEKDFERTTQGIALLAAWSTREGNRAALAVRVEKGS